MSKYELFNGDCLEVMKQLSTESVDICITDIPYGIDFSEWDTLYDNKNSALGKTSNHQELHTSFKRRCKPINGWSNADKKIPYEYEKWCNQWSSELFRLTKEGSPVLIFSGRRFLHRVCNALEDNGFMIRDIIVWEKNRCNAKAQRINNVLSKRGIFDDRFNSYRIGNLAPFYEPIIFAMKTYKSTLTDCVIKNKIGGFVGANDTIPSNVIKCNVNNRNLYHETEKPVKLIEQLIALFSIDENHVILDFTMGSGSTGVACLNTNRNFIGIELDENYFNIAKKRIEECEESVKNK